MRGDLHLGGGLPQGCMQLSEVGLENGQAP